MESQNPVNIPNPQPTSLPNISPEGNVKQDSRTLRIVIAILCFFLAVPQIVIPIMMLLFVIPKLQTLSSSISTKNFNPTFTYSVVICCIVLGLVGIFMGIKVLKNANYLKFGIIYLALLFIFQGILIAAVIRSVISPIYNLTSEIDSETPSLTTTPVPNFDSTVPWKTYTDSKDKFSIMYPSGWFVNDGLFSESNTPTTQNYDIQLIIQPKIKAENNTPSSLENYVKTSAGEETGPSRTSDTITKVVTKSGITGYVVKWQKDPSGFGGSKTYYSAYFDAPNDPSSTLQIHTDEKFLDTLYQMITTLKFTDQSTTPTPASTSCSTDSDCPADSTCMASGPLVAGETQKKICVKKGSAVPL